MHTVNGVMLLLSRENIKNEYSLIISVQITTKVRNITLKGFAEDFVFRSYQKQARRVKNRRPMSP